MISRFLIAVAFALLSVTTGACDGDRRGVLAAQEPGLAEGQASPESASEPHREIPDYHQISIQYPDGPRTVVVQDIDGWAVAGDTHFGRIEELTGGDEERGAILLGSKWPSNFVPYWIDDSPGPAGFNATQQAFIESVLDDLDGVTPLDFARQGSPGGEASVNIHRSEISCFAPPGYLPVFPNSINLTDGCASDQESIKHEMMHVLGFWHEQQRGDRDDTIEYLSGNVTVGWWQNFDFQPGVTDKGEFDFSSVMLYGSMFASSNSQPTAVRKDGFMVAEVAGSSSIVKRDWEPWFTDLDFNVDYFDFQGGDPPYVLGDFGCGVANCPPGLADVWRAAPRPTGGWDWEVLFNDDRHSGFVPIGFSSLDPNDFLFADVNGDRELDVIGVQGTAFEVALSSTSGWQPLTSSLGPSSRSDIHHIAFADMDGDGCAELVWDADGLADWEVSSSGPCPGPMPAPPGQHGGQNPVLNGLAVPGRDFVGTSGLTFEGNDLYLADFTGPTPQSTLDIFELTNSGSTWTVRETTFPPSTPGPLASAPVDVTPALLNSPAFDDILFGDYNGDQVTDALVHQLFATSPSPPYEYRRPGIFLGAAGNVPFGPVADVDGSRSPQGPSTALLRAGRLLSANRDSLLSYGLYDRKGFADADAYDLQRLYTDTWEASFVKEDPASGHPKAGSWTTVDFDNGMVPDHDVQFGDFDGDCRLDAIYWDGFDWNVRFGQGTAGLVPNYFGDPVQWKADEPTPVADARFGDFLIDGSSPPLPCDPTDAILESGGFYWAHSGATGAGVLFTTAQFPLDETEAVDLNGDRLTDLFTAHDAGLDGTWDAYFTRPTPGPTGWDTVCNGFCLDHTQDHLAFGDFDGDGANEVFSDLFVTDPARTAWYYYDLTPDAGDEWNELAETSFTFPDIVVGDFGVWPPGGPGGMPRPDVLRADGSRWLISPGGNCCWDEIGKSSVLLPDLRLVDLDRDGTTDLLHAAEMWQ